MWSTLSIVWNSVQFSFFIATCQIKIHIKWGMVLREGVIMHTFSLTWDVFDEGTFDESMVLRAFLIIHSQHNNLSGFDEGTFDESMLLRAFLIIHIFTITWRGLFGGDIWWVCGVESIPDHTQIHNDLKGLIRREHLMSAWCWEHCWLHTYLHNNLTGFWRGNIWWMHGAESISDHTYSTW